jgi:putative FmdB family regulatory protein
MPIYEYECAHCGTRFERMQPVSAAPLTECDNCGQGPVRRVFHPAGIIFKGSGWYITDSRRSGSSTNGSRPTSGSSSESAGTEAKSTADVD